MRLVLLRASAFVALALTLAGSQPARMAAQQRLPQAPGFVVLPEIRTKVEAALAAPNALLVIAGDADRIVPVDQSVALYEAGNDPKRLVVLTGADHNDDDLTAGPPVVEAVAAFLQRR